MKLSGWGKFPVIDANVSAPRTYEELSNLIKKKNAIARGNGRAYGDSALSQENTIDMKYFNRFLEFDKIKGLLVAEAGVLLEDIISTFLPKGWFPLVTPGTKYVTLGGMMAADVHGKNHHKVGCFSSCVHWFDLVAEDGNIIHCSASENVELYNWTLGGMGLTGVILRACISLQPVTSGWIAQKTIVAKNLEETLSVFEESGQASYSVAWIDCLQRENNLGRSLIMVGEHADIASLPQKLKKVPYPSEPRYKLDVPFTLPVWVLNSYILRLFNLVYYFKERIKNKNKYVTWNTFFYPLDFIKNWNKMYGSNGFIQFQCVLPLSVSKPGLQELLSTVALQSKGSFLAVLKKLKKQESYFSFPMDGYTLALDFPATKSCISLVEKLEKITQKYGGRIYLAKDSTLNAERLKKIDPRSIKFAEYRANKGKIKTFSSEQSLRLRI